MVVASETVVVVSMVSVMVLILIGLGWSAALRCNPGRRRDRGVQGARAAGPEGDHPACTERRNDVEEGWGYRPG
ncbi:hypothetical protein D3C71_2110180 [compost metagenome]